MRRTLLKIVAVVLSAVLAAPSVAVASPRKSSPEAIHSKILKRGVGSWVCVEEANGIVLLGRISNIDVVSFGIQLENYPEITVVNYSDVVRVRSMGITGKGAIALIGGAAAAAVITALVMHHEYEQNKPTMPTNPSLPSLP